MATQKQYQTPGVYVAEEDGFSSSVVQVPTAIPVFIGYTEVAKNGNQDLTNVAMPISSMAQFLTYYGSRAPTFNNGAPKPVFNYKTASATMPPYGSYPTGPHFNLYYSLMLFFNNGGGSCYIMSIGKYADVIANGVGGAGTYTTAWTNLARYTEPTMVVMPDAMLLAEADWVTVSQSALQHCNLMQSRVAIFDILNGYTAADGSPSDPTTAFYKIGGLGEDFNKYGVAYFPWLNTDIVALNSLDYTWFDAGTLANLVTDLGTEAPSLFASDSVSQQKLQAYQSSCLKLMVSPVATTPITDPTGMIAAHGIHRIAYTISPTYRQVMADLAISVNLLPPSGGMAGVYTRNDNTFGVSQAPANTTMISAVSPTVDISDADQENLNMPLNGMAINAIRSFPNAGLLIWGARTMAGNSDDWRYISVRRTMIMLEQSIKAAMQAYVFQANDNLNWVNINSAISNFLNSQWKAGALVGAKPADAYSVAVGLGSTMTGEDILQGYLRVQVEVAVVHPAEFIVLTFQQQMQTS
jgi:uncharacterized protein